MRRAAMLILAGALSAAACGPPTVRPASYPSPDVSCPGSRPTWDLQIQDQRADRVDQAKVVAAIRDAIQKSFPGCHWTVPKDADTGTIAIEVHRFGAVFDTGAWEAAVEWSVAARGADGAALTEFETNEEVSRPNYQGSDNEKEAMSEAFRKAVERTARGLSSVPVTENVRPRPGTLDGGGRQGASGRPSLTR
jgi:hypothetical protein